MSLQDTIQADLKDAMKARDRERMSALRMAISALKNAAIAANLGPQGALPDPEAQRVLATEVKRRREAAQAFRDAGREDQAATEEAEIGVYEAYLPAQFGDDEVAALVDQVIAETGASGPSDMGSVMKAAMGKVAGRADGNRISAVVKERLAALQG